MAHPHQVVNEGLDLGAAQGLHVHGGMKSQKPADPGEIDPFGSPAVPARPQDFPEPEQGTQGCPIHGGTS
jgi:hypothetical protein